MTLPWTEIHLTARESECIACGAPLFNCKRSIPVYEGEALPNEWTVEWGGCDACDKCADAQALLTEPVSLAELARLAGHDLSRGGRHLDDCDGWRDDCDGEREANETWWKGDYDRDGELAKGAEELVGNDCDGVDGDGEDAPIVHILAWGAGARSACGLLVGSDMPKRHRWAYSFDLAVATCRTCVRRAK